MWSIHYIYIMYLLYSMYIHVRTCTCTSLLVDLYLPFPLGSFAYSRISVWSIKRDKTIEQFRRCLSIEGTCTCNYYYTTYLLMVLYCSVTLQFIYIYNTCTSIHTQYNLPNYNYTAYLLKVLYNYSILLLVNNYW